VGIGIFRQIPGLLNEIIAPKRVYRDSPVNFLCQDESYVFLILFAIIKPPGCPTSQRKEIFMVDLHKRFEKCQAYIRSQVSGEGIGRDRMPKPYPAITISRETGAGAVPLADKLADRLNKQLGAEETLWTVFDKNLVQQVLADHDLPAHLERFMPEDKLGQIEDAFGGLFGTHPSDLQLVRLTQETIYRLAKMGRCILVGRGANIITRNLPNVLHLRMVGALENRIKRCMEQYQFNEAQANEYIKKEDRARRRYLLAYYDRDIDDPMDYHLIVNVEQFTTQKLVDMIANMIGSWN
jgi:hypothetical protein